MDCKIPIAEVEQEGLGPIINTSVNSNVQSVSVQTECFVRNKKVQTVDTNIAPVKIMRTKGTQTLLTHDYLLRKLCPLKLVSSACQTSPISDEVNVNMNIDEFENASQVDENIYPLPSVNEDISQLTSDPIELIPSDDIVEKNQEYALMEQLSSDPIPSDEIDEKDQENDDEEYYNATNEESDDEEEIICNDEEEIICNDEKITSERVMLSNDKLPKDQLKIIVFEESIANVFRVCFKCSTCCNVFVERQIGTYCKMGVFCSANPDHNFSWTTGPLCNRLPIINLMIASSIVCTGMECSKTLRFLESLNIMRIQRREFSNLQQTYVIPAVFNVWKREQLKLLEDIKDKSIK